MTIEGGGQEPPDNEEAAPAKRKPRTISMRISLVVLLAILIAVLGEVHIVHGGGTGLHVCEKDGWSLSDTFVDMDDYVGKPVLELLDKAKVVRALRACDLLTLQSPDESAPDE